VSATIAVCAATLPRLLALALARPDVSEADRAAADRIIAQCRRKLHEQIAVNDRNQRIGEDHPNAKLSSKQAEELRDLYERGQQMPERERRAAGLTQRKLAVRYGISHGGVSDVISFRSHGVATNFRSTHQCAAGTAQHEVHYYPVDPERKRRL
jgi:hypothetical protein